MKKRKRAEAEYSSGKNGGIITAVVLTGLVAVSVLLSLTVFFKLVNVEVSGKYYSYSADEIIRAADIQEGCNLLRIDCREIEDKIEAELPYLLDVNVYRTLPDTVTIEVNNVRTRLAVACEDGTYLIVSDSLKILEKSETAPDDCVIVYGIKPESLSTGRILRDENGLDLDIYLKPFISAAGKVDLLTGIDSVNLSDKLNITMIFDGRIFVEMGTASEMDYKFNMISEVVKREDKKLSGNLNVSISGKAFLSDNEMTVPENYYN